MYRSMNIKSLSVALSTLVLSTSANAAIISYGGYSHDTTTDIVTGNGLEWLQWDRTLGQSISSIQSQLNTLEGGGWSIASNTQMAQLFNAFDFGLTFDNDENTGQTLNTGFSIGDPSAEADELLISMFGDTFTATGNQYCYGGDCYERTLVIYGNDLDNDTFLNQVHVSDDYISSAGQNVAGQTVLYADSLSPDWAHPQYGVALVRDVSAVPIAPAVWLFGSGLIGLIGVARRKA